MIRISPSQSRMKFNRIIIIRYKDMLDESPIKKNINSQPYNLRKTTRITYALTQDSKCSDEQKPNADNPAPKIIYSINFGEDAMIIVAKSGILVYSVLTMKVIFTRNGFFWDAVFIPETSCLAVVEHDGTGRSKRTLKILDMMTDTCIAEATITFELEHLKASKHCIGLAGISEVAVMHFPTLKPICHETTGTGLFSIFDLSYEGLTLAYQCQKKGTIIIHNFTNVAASQYRRKQSMGSNLSRGQSQYSSVLKKKVKTTKQVIQIEAHKENVCLIRVSPNGSRVATASSKGTLIRIFLTASGKLWEQLRVGYQLCKVLDMHFYEEGNVLACINEKNMVHLFNVKLQSNEENFESQRRGYQIYQQKNPKSMFSFLSFLYNNFGNELPFAFKQLLKPKQPEEAKQGDKDKSKEQNLERPDSKQFMPVVFEEQEIGEKQSESREESPSRNLSGTESIQKKESYDEKKSTALLDKLKKSNNQTPNEYRRSSSISTKLHKKHSLLQFKKQDLSFVPKVFNTVTKIFVGGNNFIWVAKGSYVFTLKYDPFNGGQMYHKDTMTLH